MFVVYFQFQVITISTEKLRVLVRCHDILMLTSLVIKKDCAIKSTVYSVTLHLIIKVKTMTQKYYYYGIPIGLNIIRTICFGDWLFLHPQAFDNSDHQ